MIPYVPKTLGLSQLKINEFVKIFKDKGYDELKLNYIRELMIFISKNGYLDKQDLFEFMPFADILNFNEINELLDKIFDILD